MSSLYNIDKRERYLLLSSFTKLEETRSYNFKRNYSQPKIYVTCKLDMSQRVIIFYTVYFNRKQSTTQPQVTINIE